MTAWLSTLAALRQAVRDCDLRLEQLKRDLPRRHAATATYYNKLCLAHAKLHQAYTACTAMTPKPLLALIEEAWSSRRVFDQQADQLDETLAVYRQQRKDAGARTRPWRKQVKLRFARLILVMGATQLWATPMQAAAALEPKIAEYVKLHNAHMVDGAYRKRPLVRWINNDDMVRAAFHKRRRQP